MFSQLGTHRYVGDRHRLTKNYASDAMKKKKNRAISVCKPVTLLLQSAMMYV